MGNHEPNLTEQANTKTFFDQIAKVQDKIENIETDTEHSDNEKEADYEEDEVEIEIGPLKNPEYDMRDFLKPVETENIEEPASFLSRIVYDEDEMKNSHTNVPTQKEKEEKTAPNVETPTVPFGAPLTSNLESTGRKTSADLFDDIMDHEMSDNNPTKTPEISPKRPKNPKNKSKKSKLDRGRSESFEWTEAPSTLPKEEKCHEQEKYDPMAIFMNRNKSEPAPVPPPVKDRSKTKSG